MTAGTWWVALAATLVVVLAAVWLWWTADRLDRMHRRIDLTRASLDAQLLRRSSAALELATTDALDPARSLLLVDSAHQARAADPAGLGRAESDLSETLRAVLCSAEEVAALRRDPIHAALLDELAVACGKVELARRFHNDVVARARGLRSRRLVRWLRLAGHAADLSTVDLDDTAPQALVDDTAGWDPGAGTP